MARRNGSVVEVRKPADVTADNGAGAVADVETQTPAGTAMTREQLVEFYRLMYLSRRTDDREIVLKRPAEDFFPDIVRRA